MNLQSAICRDKGLSKGFRNLIGFFSISLYTIVRPVIAENMGAIVNYEPWSFWPIIGNDLE